jgi:2-hydroxy-3-keto-5-methylthiopentenyl-1-phosphate phosphatase
MVIYCNLGEDSNVTTYVREFIKKVDEHGMEYWSVAAGANNYSPLRRT